MSAHKVIAAALPLLLWAALVTSAQGTSHYEDEVQYALEKLTSGTSTAATVGGTHVTVTPQRTWKSVTGHYCREFLLTVREPDSAVERLQGIRCRDRDGKWKTPRQK
jgi:surface antigen